jgi:hypothetical protein
VGVTVELDDCQVCSSTMLVIGLDVMSRWLLMSSGKGGLMNVIK